MNAVEFIKQYGWEIAKRDVVCLEAGFITKADFIEHYGFEILDDLKQLVDAWELVQKHGGLKESNERLFHLALIGEIEKVKALSKAIELVESVK